MKILFTEKELQDIESWRVNTTDPSKFTCVWLQKFKARILTSLSQSSEKSKCFCSKGDRVSYHKSFYLFYDNYNAERTV